MRVATVGYSDWSPCPDQDTRQSIHCCGPLIHQIIPNQSSISMRPFNQPRPPKSIKQSPLPHSFNFVRPRQLIKQYPLLQSFDSLSRAILKNQAISSAEVLSSHQGLANQSSSTYCCMPSVHQSINQSSVTAAAFSIHHATLNQ